MTTSLKSAGGGIASGSAVQTGNSSGRNDRAFCVDAANAVDRCDASQDDAVASIGTSSSIKGASAVCGALLYEHEDGRHLVALPGSAMVAGVPGWHRVGPAEIEAALRTDAVRADSDVRTLLKVRVMAEAASAWVERYRGCEMDRDKCATLFDSIALRCEDAISETDALARTALGAQRGGGLQNAGGAGFISDDGETFMAFAGARSRLIARAGTETAGIADAIAGMVHVDEHRLADPKLSPDLLRLFCRRLYTLACATLSCVDQNESAAEIEARVFPQGLYGKAERSAELGHE